MVRTPVASRLRSLVDLRVLAVAAVLSGACAPGETGNQGTGGSSMSGTGGNRAGEPSAAEHAPCPAPFLGWIGPPPR